MRFTTSAILSVLVGLVPALAAPTVPPSPFMGVINSPATATSIVAGSPFDFSYGVSNWCNEGYNHFKVFLTSGATPPTYDDLDNTGEISDALFGFGQFAVANYGLPPASSPPPSQFTAPGVTIPDGENAYLSVVQIFSSCPGHVVQELGVTSVEVEYSSA